jgi:hypothetical protein
LNYERVGAVGAIIGNGNFLIFLLWLKSATSASYMKTCFEYCIEVDEERVREGEDFSCGREAAKKRPLVAAKTILFFLSSYFVIPKNPHPIY